MAVGRDPIVAFSAKHPQLRFDLVTHGSPVLLHCDAINLVSLVQVLGLEEVHDGEDLTVVGHEGLADGVAARDESLQDVEGRRDDFSIAGVQGRCTKSS